MSVFARISDYYNTLVDKHGHDPRACDYGHPASQQIKFTILEAAIPAQAKTLLDVGCGFADFAAFLAARRPGLRYTGIDLSPRMIEQAKNLHPQLDLRHANLLETTLPPFDVVTANGIFYLLGKDADPLMQQLLSRMYSLSTQAVLFNSLSRWATDQEPDEFYADPLETVAFCKTLTPWVTLRHDYHTRDFTVALYRDRQGMPV